MKNMSDLGQIRHSFSTKSQSYAKNCALQNEVAKILLAFCDEFLCDSQKIIDLGAGSGNVAKNLSQFLSRDSRQIAQFVALDFAPQMLSLHPRILPHLGRIECIECDFERFDFSRESFELILSSSALQWAKDLNRFAQIVRESSAKKFAFAIFTSESLGDLHAFLGTDSPLRSANKVRAIFGKYFKVQSFLKRFEVHFPTSEAFLDYLKKSALLGGGNLNFSQKKQLKCDLPLKCANFEVIFLKGSKQ